MGRPPPLIRACLKENVFFQLTSSLRPFGNHDGHFDYDDFDANVYRLLFHDARDDFHYALSASIHIN